MLVHRLHDEAVFDRLADEEGGQGLRTNNEQGPVSEHAPRADPSPEPEADIAGIFLWVRSKKAGGVKFKRIGVAKWVMKHVPGPNPLSSLMEMRKERRLPDVCDD